MLLWSEKTLFIALYCIAYPFSTEFYAELARAHKQKGGFFLRDLVREKKNRLILVNKFGDLSFFSRILGVAIRFFR